MLFKKRKKKKVEEILTSPRLDRRILSNVPDPENIRMMEERRGRLDNQTSKNLATKDIEKFRTFNLRYEANFDVILVKKGQKKKGKIKAKAVDISSTGLLIELNENVDPFELGTEVIARFNIPSGTMPEGFESKVKINATTIRIFEKNEKQMMAIQFEKPLTEYFQKKRWGYSVYTASAFLFVAVLFVMLLRVESIIYFKYNLLLYLYSLIAASFLLTRYLFGAFYRDVPINPNYTPGVSIIIPCFNEEEWISRTILSCINQDYPVDKLEVIVVDDRSTDGTVKEIEKTIEMVHREADRFMTKERLKMHVLPVNGGKREALVQGVDIISNTNGTILSASRYCSANIHSKTTKRGILSKTIRC